MNGVIWSTLPRDSPARHLLVFRGEGMQQTKERIAIPTGGQITVFYFTYEELRAFKFKLQQIRNFLIRCHFSFLGMRLRICLKGGMNYQPPFIVIASWEGINIAFHCNDILSPLSPNYCHGPPFYSCHLIPGGDKRKLRDEP